jgi:hypothetical protein
MEMAVLMMLREGVECGCELVSTHEAPSKGMHERWGGEGEGSVDEREQ